MNESRRQAPEGLPGNAELTGALLSDLGASLDTLAALAALADAGEEETRAAGMARWRAACERMRRLVRDVGEEVRGKRAAPEVEFSPAEVARGACSAWMETAPGIVVDYRCAVAGAAPVRGRSSLLAHAVESLLQHAARRAGQTVRVRLEAAARHGAPGVRLRVEDDGEPLAPEGEDGLLAARWAVERLGGSLVVGRGGARGGGLGEIWLPAAPLCGGPVRASRSAGPLAGRAVAVVDAVDGRRAALARHLRREGAVAMELSPEFLFTPDSLAAAVATTDAEVVLLQMQLGPTSGMAVLDALRRIAPPMVERVVLLSGADDPEPAEGSARPRGYASWSHVRQAILDHLADPPASPE